MQRGIGEFGPIQELIPDWAAVLVALLTQLGDGWFLFLVLVAVYWLHRPKRAEVAVVAGTVYIGIALYRTLKELFALPRPEEPLVHVELLPRYVQPLYEATALAGGYGFPSGHAVSSTIVYFGLAAALTAGTRRLRYLVAGVLVSVVCFTRVALGVHYLVDVVAGVALGLAVLGGARVTYAQFRLDRPTMAFSLAVAFGLVYEWVSGDTQAVLLVGASLGAVGGWQLVLIAREVFVIDERSVASRAVAARIALAVVAFAPLVAALDQFGLLTAYAGASAVGFATALVVLVPVLRRPLRAGRD